MLHKHKSKAITLKQKSEPNFLVCIFYSTPFEMAIGAPTAYDNKSEEILTTSLKEHLDSEFIDGIRTGNKDVINTVYHKYFPKVKSIILKNSGNEEDARDIFQETFIAIYKNVQRSDFKLTCKFETYVHAIARNLWFAVLRKKRNYFSDTNDFHLSESISDLEETIISAERYALYVKTFETIGEQCKKLLLMFIEGVPMKNIALELGFASESYAKKRKFKCKEQLIKKITEDNDYKRIMAQ